MTPEALVGILFRCYDVPMRRLIGPLLTGFPRHRHSLLTSVAAVIGTNQSFLTIVALTPDRTRSTAREFRGTALSFFTTHTVAFVFVPLAALPALMVLGTPVVADANFGFI